MKNLLDHSNYIESVIRYALAPNIERGYKTDNEKLADEIIWRLRGLDIIPAPWPRAVDKPEGYYWVDHQEMRKPPGWYVEFPRDNKWPHVPNVVGPMTEDEANAYLRRYWEEQEKMAGASNERKTKTGSG